MQNLVFRNRLKTEKDSPNQQINQNLRYAVVHKLDHRNIKFSFTTEFRTILLRNTVLVSRNFELVLDCI